MNPQEEHRSRNDRMALMALLDHHGSDWLLEQVASLCADKALTLRLRGDRGAAAAWDRTSTVLAAVQTALGHPAPTPGEGVVQVLGAAKEIVDSSVEDFQSGVRDGTYEADEANLARLAGNQATAESLGRLIPAISALYSASQAVLDAMGGWTPDFLKDEAPDLEDAIIAVDACAVTAAAPEPIAGPRP